jgi:hypothetical protein
MELRVVSGLIGGAIGSWINAYAIRDEEEEIISMMPMVVCVARRPRPVRGLSL